MTQEKVQENESVIKVAGSAVSSPSPEPKSVDEGASRAEGPKVPLQDVSAIAEGSVKPTMESSIEKPSEQDKTAKNIHDLAHGKESHPLTVGILVHHNGVSALVSIGTGDPEDAQIGPVPAKVGELQSLIESLIAVYPAKNAQYREALDEQRALKQTEMDSKKEAEKIEKETASSKSGERSRQGKRKTAIAQPTTPATPASNDSNMSGNESPVTFSDSNSETKNTARKPVEQTAFAF